MIIKEALKKAKDKLQDAKIENYSWEAEELLSFVIKKDRAYILAHQEEILNKSKEKKYLKR